MDREATMKLIDTVVIPSTQKTLYMVGFSSFFALIFGIIIGLTLYLVQKDGLKENKYIYLVLSSVVNVGRSIPFIILIFIFFPITRLIVGTALGTKAASVSLTLAAIPFVSRLMETSFNDVDKDVIDAAVAMGSSNFQILTKVVVLESIQNVIANITTAIISIVGYSAMAGSLGGGGLGDIAISYGFQRNNTFILIVATVLLVILVQTVQFFGNLLSRNIVHILESIRRVSREKAIK